MKRFASFLLFITILMILSGCAAKQPILWETRINQTSSNPYLPAYNDTGKRGSQHTLLFLHGFGESRYTWDHLIKKLQTRYRCIAPDLKGFGYAPKPDDQKYSVYDQAVYVRALITQLDLQDVTIIGHSYGGGIALTLALMPEMSPGIIKRIILIDSMAYPQRLPSMMRLLNTPLIGHLAIYGVPTFYQTQKAYEYAFYDDAKIPSKSIELTTRFLSLPGAKRAYLSVVDDIIPDDLEITTKRYRQISIPALLLWGEKDTIVKPSIGQRLHHDLPNSHLVMIPHCGHMPQEESPEAVLRAFETFMAKSPVESSY